MGAKRTPRSVKSSCDKLFSLLIRSKGSCERCSKTEPLQCAHIFSRKFGSVRFEEENALCLCYGCHSWAHFSPIDFTEFVKTKKDIDKLREMRNKIVKRKLHDWIELESDLKSKLNDK